MRNGDSGNNNTALKQVPARYGITRDYICDHPGDGTRIALVIIRGNTIAINARTSLPL